MHLIVVGGGFAGVSAAVALSEAGHRVDLYESKGLLGGRVYSVAPPPGFPCPLDNGPHLFLGAYRETLSLIKKLRRDNPFQCIDPLALEWLLVGGRKVSLRAWPLPAPFHLLSGLLRSDAFPFSEKTSLVSALIHLRFHRHPGMTVSTFLKKSSAGPAALERFWGPLTRAVMNMPPEQGPVDGLSEIFRRAFFSRRSDSALAIPRVPLSDLLGDHVHRFLVERGGAVHLREGLTQLRRTPSGLEGVITGGVLLKAEGWVLAVPPDRLAALLPGESWAQPPSHLGKSAIVSVHYHLSHSILSAPLTGLSGAKFEWVFNRNQNYGLPGEGQILSLISSADQDLVQRPDKEILALAWQNLKDRCPEAAQTRILAQKTTREPAATFAWTPDTGPLRPGPVTPLPNVLLAGDWTATGLPATIEGAVLSGRKAAAAFPSPRSI